MLDHPNIEVVTGVEFEDVRAEADYDRLIFTGPIDEYFDHRYGKLPYRSLQFEHETLDQAWFQPVATVNYPSEDYAYTRITEYKHLTGQAHPKTTITYEYPRAEGDPYYPIPRRGEPGAVQEVRGPGARGPRTSTSSAGWRPTATTTWTR